MVHLTIEMLEEALSSLRETPEGVTAETVRIPLLSWLA